MSDVVTVMASYIATAFGTIGLIVCFSAGLVAACWTVREALRAWRWMLLEKLGDRLIREAISEWRARHPERAEAFDRRHDELDD